MYLTLTSNLTSSFYDWAWYKTRKGAVKLHMLLDYDGCIPAFAVLTRVDVHKTNMARKLELPSGSILVFDMGYYDFSWGNKLDGNEIFFVIRDKDNLSYKVIESFDVSKERADNILEHCKILINSLKGKKEYPKILQLVRFWEKDNQKELVFLTNNRYWTIKTISRIYKERWQIESFFKIIKQNLRLKSFFAQPKMQYRFRFGWH